MAGKTVHSGDSDQSADAPGIPSWLRDCLLRSHDAWALPVDVLLETTGMTCLEADLPENVPAALAGRLTEAYIVTMPGLDEGIKEHLIRQLLGKYLASEPSSPGQRNESGDKIPNPFNGLVVEQVGDWPQDWKPIRADVAALYQQSDWAPTQCWRTDDKVIEALKAMLADHLDGTAIDVSDDVDFPEDAGGAITWDRSVDGELHPLVSVREDLPSDLRADLWGFCIALVDCAESEGVEPDEEGYIYVGCERSPVTGPGAGLLGALMVQRFGRRAGDCSFPILNRQADGAENTSKAA